MRCLAVLFLSTLAFSCTKKEPPRAAEVLVSNEDSNDVTVIDAATNQVIRTVFVGKRPRGIRVSHDGKLAFVALSGSPKPKPKAGKPHGGGVRRRRRRARKADPAIADCCRRHRRPRSRTEGKLLQHLRKGGQDPEAFDLVGDDTIVVSNEETAEASFVEIKSGAVARHRPRGRSELRRSSRHPPRRRGGCIVYVTSDGEDKGVAAHRRRRRGKVVAVFKTGGRPRGVLFTADSKRAFVSNELGGTVSIIDATSHTVVGEIHFERGNGPTPPRLRWGSRSHPTASACT